MVAPVLTRDRVTFEAEFREASAFLRAAELRRELYALALKDDITSWGRARIVALRTTPACSEPWFVESLGGMLDNR